MKQYKGSKPFIFVCLSKNDDPVLRPIFSRMSEEGYRIFYRVVDAVDSVSSADLKRVRKCAFFIPCISRNSVCADTAGRLLSAADDYSRAILPIVLDNSALPMDWAYCIPSSIQRLYFAGETDVFNRSLREPLRACLDKNKSLRLYTRIAFAAVLCIVAVVFAFRYINDNYSMLFGSLQDISDVNSLVWGDEEIPASLEEISNFTDLNTLDITWDGSDSELAYLQKNKNLEKLVIRLPECYDLTHIGELTSLKHLELTLDNDIDLSPLANLTDLEALYIICPTNPGFEWVSSLRKLHTFDIRCMDLLSVSLETLDREPDGNYADISYFDGLTELKTLSLRGLWLNDLSALGSLLNLESLSLSDVVCESLDSLHGLDRMRELAVYGDYFSDISAVGSMTELRTLDLTSAKSLRDISPLSACRKLERLDVSSTEVSDVSALSGLTELNVLNLYYNHISDISPLSRLTNLTVLDLSGNNIHDISALSGLTGLTSLYLSDNRITDISPLSGMRSLATLYMNNNPISDLSPIYNLKSLYELYVFDIDIDDDTLYSIIDEHLESVLVFG